MNKDKVNLTPLRIAELKYNGESLNLFRRAKYVFFQVVENPVKYPKGFTRIVYIGECHTVANNAEGLKQPVDFIVRWFGIGKYADLKPKSNANTTSVYFINLEEGVLPSDIEEAFIYAFKSCYGDIPKGNVHGIGFTEDKVKKVEREHGIKLDSLITTLKFFED